eukprot:5956136-Pleurochrysis_carterae.AAC.1
MAGINVTCATGLNIAMHDWCPSRMALPVGCSKTACPYPIQGCSERQRRLQPGRMASLRVRHGEQ